MTAFPIVCSGDNGPTVAGHGPVQVRLERVSSAVYNGLMSTISIQEIERDPTAFLHRIEGGESLLVTRDNLPIAEIRPVPSSTNGPRPFGLCAGDFVVPDGFDDPLPEYSGRGRPLTE